MIDLPPMTPPLKRSVTIDGHRTSVSLEEAFWRGIADAARTRGMTRAHLIGQIEARIAGKPLTAFKYRDFGSLVSLGHYSTVGSLMGFIRGRNMLIVGLFARMMYRSLYKMHERALHGTVKTALDAMARALTRRTESRVKLH